MTQARLYVYIGISFAAILSVATIGLHEPESKSQEQPVQAPNTSARPSPHSSSTPARKGG